MKSVFRIPQFSCRTSFATGIFFTSIATATAAPTLWTVDAADSFIELQGTVNGEARTVTLPNLSGTISFDPDHPETAAIAVDIPISGITDKLAEAVSTLKSNSWFDVKSYPLATYTAAGVEPTDPELKTGESFTANGTLALKGVETPVPVTFTFDDGLPTTDSPKTAATATAEINRLDFDIGADWNKKLPSYKIGEDVDVTIYIVATADTAEANTETKTETEAQQAQ